MKRKLGGRRLRYVRLTDPYTSGDAQSACLKKANKALSRGGKKSVGCWLGVALNMAASLCSIYDGA